MSTNSKYYFLEQAYPDMLTGIDVLIQKAKLSKRFESIEISDSELELIKNAKELCELRIVELWDNQENEQFKILCSVYLDIAEYINIPIDNEYFIFEQLKLIAFGYLGEHWHLVRQYLKLNSKLVDELVDDDKWNRRLLTICFKSIVSLVRKENWKDINNAIILINQLRNEQKNFESEFLNQVNEESRPYGAAEVVSLYYFTKSIEIVAQYLIEGRPLEPETQVTYYINHSKEFAQKSNNLSLSLLYKFCEALFSKIIRNTIWYSTRGINTWVTNFNKFITKKESNSIFELLYPQRESIIKGELFNPSHRAIIVNLPTSSGKTIIAEYRILQALNQFKQQGGWVAYVAPTKALVNQVFIQLSKDFNSIGLKVEKASGAIELDGFEQYLLDGNNTDFDVLVTTYEKLNLLVRQGLGTTNERPLVLTVVDEAHNIEEKTRGLNLEFLLSTINNDCEESNFLLMTPDISNSDEIAKWLAGDRGNVINLSFDWWQPNERVVGAIEVNGRGKNYDFELKPLHTDKGTFEIGDNIPLAKIIDGELNKSEICNSKIKIASKISSLMLDEKSPIIVLAAKVDDTYSIAETLYNSSKDIITIDEDIELVSKFVESELGADFPLSKYLKRRIAFHSSALPDEIKFLIEDLMVKQKLQALVATTTIAQGINFPVSAIVIGAYNYPFTGEMPVRDFWNLAGRVGRAGQKSMGWVGIAVKNSSDLLTVSNYVKRASDNLSSQLLNAIESALKYSEDNFDKWLFVDERWSAILQYISHLRKQINTQEEFIAQLEQKLQVTLGYGQLPQDKKDFLKRSIRKYAQAFTLAEAKQSDSTGFSTISVRQMIGRLSGSGISPSDWNSNQLFSEQNNTMQKLIGIMMSTYEIRKSIDELNNNQKPLDHASIARLVIDWVNGKDIENIAKKFYPEQNSQEAIKNATKALYKVIANAATWGLAALQQMPTSGVDWDSLSDLERKKKVNLPAYLHYGVNSDAGVLMRKNNIPRSIAKRMGELYDVSVSGDIFNQSSSEVVSWLNNQNINTWQSIISENSKLTGEDYRKIWKKLSGLDV